MMLKLRLIPQILLFLFLLGSVRPVQAQVVITDSIDAEIALITPQIAAFQASYILQVGKGSQYYQMLWSHTTAPTDGSIKTADNLNAKPTDRPDDGTLLWQTIKSADTTSDYRIRVDTYDGPLGKGYIVVYQVEISKGLWQRSVNVGPDKHFEEPWHLVEPQ